MKLLGSILSTILFFLIFISPTQAQDSLAYGPNHYEIDHDLKTELNLVYIGASWCPPCRTDSLKEALENIKLALYKKAKKRNMNYSVIGVANDREVQKGWDFLNNSGYYDEVIIGKKWINSGSIEFILNFEEVLPGIPQIVVFKRSLEFDEGINAGRGKVLVRKIGEEAITEWYQDGASIQK